MDKLLGNRDARCDHFRCTKFP